VAEPKPVPEDPVRLRECLEALSEACGHDVFRVETVFKPGGGYRVILTCSREVRELDVARILAAELIRATNGERWEDAEPEAEEPSEGELP
jgi:hypothetical protein